MKFNHRIKLFLALLIGLIQIQKSIAQEIKPVAKLDSISIEIGDQVWLTLSAEQPKMDKIIFPSFKDRIIDGIDLLETSKTDTQIVDDGKIIVKQRLLITAFDDSLFKIPPFRFIHNLDTLYTDSLLLMVNYVRVDSTEYAKIDTNQVMRIYDVKAPVNTPWTLKEFLQIYYPYILLMIGFIIIVALVIYYLKRRKKNKPFIKLPEKPKEPAHVIALRALDDLKAKKLWQSEKVKLYYSELTDILRTYIEERFTIPTFERTSHEILESFKHYKKLDDQLYTELKQILSFADLAKFAKYKPLPDENDFCLKNAYHFVEKTATTDNEKTGLNLTLNDNQITVNEDIKILK